LKALPNICPECGSEIPSGEALTATVAIRDRPSKTQVPGRCPNPDCPAQVRGRLEHWCAPDAMDIDVGGETLVARLVQHGLVCDVADLYKLTAGELLQLKCMGEKSAQNFLSTLEASKSHDLWRILHGLRIPHVGAGEAQALAGGFKDIDELIHASFDQLNAIHDVADVSAQSVVEWFGDSHNRELIKRLRKAGLNFQSSLHQARKG